ncbi:MAG TPA: COX15/CtaA family protein [Polyangiaceae bacterium]|nr:COX15/CtaA family protein [Polyangiaceae bacterium]
MIAGSVRFARFALFAWALLAYDVAVVAWGAYVRASGAGAGCGRHWPTCNGEVVPRAPQLATLIEFSHRLTSGVAFLLTGVLLAWAFVAFPQGHRVRKGAIASMALMAAEAVIGAGLVLLALVAHDASVRRAVGVGLHLVNTFFLLAATSLTAFWASGGGASGPPPAAGPAPRLRSYGALLPALGVLLGGMVVVGASGAITALGDTLFPVPSLAAGLAQDFSPSAHVFVRLRAVHPVLAVLLATGIVVVTAFARAARPTHAVTVLSRVTGVLAVAQVAMGLLDMTLRAPVALQLMHVVLADALWMALVLTTGAVLSEAPSESWARGAREREQEREQHGAREKKSGIARGVSRFS